MITFRVSFSRNDTETLGQRLHLPLQGCRRELLATAYADMRSAATMAPASAFPTALWSSRERRKDGEVEHGPVLRRNRGEAKRGRDPAGPRLRRGGIRLAPWEGVRTLPLPSKEAYEVLCRRRRVSAMTPYTANARVTTKAINSEDTGGPPVSANAVAVGLAAAVAVPVAVAVGFAVAVAPLTVTLPTIPIDSCGMQ